MSFELEEKNAQRYKVLINGVVVNKGWTYDFNRRVAEVHTRMYDQGKIEVKKVLSGFQ